MRTGGIKTSDLGTVGLTERTQLKAAGLNAGVLGMFVVTLSDLPRAGTWAALTVDAGKTAHVWSKYPGAFCLILFRTVEPFEPRSPFDRLIAQEQP